MKKSEILPDSWCKRPLEKCLPRVEEVVVGQDAGTLSPLRSVRRAPLPARPCRLTIPSWWPWGKPAAAPLPAPGLKPHRAAIYTQYTCLGVSAIVQVANPPSRPASPSGTSDASGLAAAMQRYQSIGRALGEGTLLGRLETLLACPLLPRKPDQPPKDKEYIGCPPIFRF